MELITLTMAQFIQVYKVAILVNHQAPYKGHEFRKTKFDSAIIYVINCTFVKMSAVNKVYNSLNSLQDIVSTHKSSNKFVSSFL